MYAILSLLPVSSFPSKLTRVLQEQIPIFPLTTIFTLWSMKWKHWWQWWIWAVICMGCYQSKNKLNTPLNLREKKVESRLPSEKPAARMLCGLTGSQSRAKHSPLWPLRSAWLEPTFTVMMRCTYTETQTQDSRANLLYALHKVKKKKVYCLKFR